MPIIIPPLNYNLEDLYPYVELLSYPEIGSKGIDFMGAKTYNVGFMQAGVGFGITGIKINITPSMQPIVEISFKDFYGNLAMEFERNQEFLKKISNSSNTDELNYSSLFELPYPKFKLVIKGLIGKPAALELNVKRIDVTYQPNDGSYEIKATFIPNLYGFFADMPYYFLKAIKGLRKDGQPTIFNLIEVGTKLEQQKQFVNKNTEVISSKLVQLQQLSESVLGDDFDLFKSIPNKVNNVQIGNMKEIFINVESGSKRSSTTNIQGTSETSKRSRQALKSANANDIIVKKVVSSLSEGAPLQKKVNLFDEPLNAANLQRGQQILNRALKEIDEFTKTEFTTGNQELIKQITISSVFDLLVKDSAYLLGKILAAGHIGFVQDKNRINQKNLIGKYYPLIQSPDNNEQVPYAVNGPEGRFVNEFIKSLTEGLVEEQRKQLTKSELPDDTNNQLKKRITNLEIGKSNPYALSINAQSLMENIMERCGLAGHFFMDSYPIFSSLANDDDVNSMVDSELQNINEGLKKLEQIQLEQINSFCNFISKEINADGDLIDSNFSSNLDKLKIIRSYINPNSKINKETLQGTQVFNNGINYIYPGTSSSDYYVLFSTADFKNTNITTSIGTTQGKDFSLSSFMAEDGDDTKPFDDNQFKIEYVTKDNISNINSLISDKKVFRFNIMQTQLNQGVTSINDLLQSTKLSDTLDINNSYFFTTYILNDRNSGYIWDFLGDSDEATAQRYILRNICKRLKGLIEKNKKESEAKLTEIRDKFRQQDTFKIFYTQFHHLCNNWKNLIRTDSSNESALVEEIIKRFTTGNKANIKYEIPLQEIQNGSGPKIKLENAIVNVKPLQDNNSQSTVLSVMSNVCHLNNFMFLAIPGLGEEDNKTILSEKLSDIFKPFTSKISPDSIKAGNLFYVLWTPTPENRVKYNNGEPLYVPFKPNLQKDVFEVNFGASTNTVFKSINLTTEDNKVTAESAIAINTIADSQNSNKFKNYDCSALSVMEGRSYKISCDMLGCAQIKPTQFFVLNATKVFTGLYQIMKVEHIISPQEFTTRFEAIKMKYSGKGDSFVYVPPVTLENLGLNQNDNDTVQTEESAQDQNTEVTASGSFPISNSSMIAYLGTITHNSIGNPERALLDTISFLDNGIMTENYGYDVLVGHRPQSPRLIENWITDYPGGHNYNAWKLSMFSPTLNRVVNTSAAGRYQIVNTTWKNVIKSDLGIPWTGNIVDSTNVPFNKDNQDLCASSLLRNRLLNGGYNISDIEFALSDSNHFRNILKSLKEEWESIKLLIQRGSYKGRDVKEYYDFFVEAYNIYQNQG